MRRVLARGRRLDHDPITALPFRQLDVARRLMGAFLDLGGHGAQESQFRIAAEIPGAQLRAYQGKREGRGYPILIVPAPFKKPYVWDLLPAVSAVRQCRQRDLSVYLLEWDKPDIGSPNRGLADFADRIPYMVTEAIAAETGRSKVVLAGHSLGGTFAAICAALHPNIVAGLLLMETPLSFTAGGPLTLAAAVGLPVHAILPIVGSPVAGSALNLMSVMAAPDAFYWHPMLDLLASAGDVEALTVHAAARRWTLDESPLPGRLFAEVVEWLYREDRLVAGELRLGGRSVGLEQVHAPILAVVNPKGRVVPPRSTLMGLTLTRGPANVLHYRDEVGVVLEHIGALIGPRAHAQLWPRIVEWLQKLSRGKKMADETSLP